MRFLKPATLVILLMVSCTLPEKESTAEPAYSVEEDIPKPQEQQRTRVHVVEIRQMKFEPTEVKVRKGDEVRWVNKDITNHDVTEQSKKSWASSPLATGQSWSLVVTESVDYYCNLHQVMKGKITVEKAPNQE